MKFHIEAVCGIPDAVFDDEVPPRSWLLSMFLADMRGQEDLYLAEIGKAEAGKTITNLYNNMIDVQLHPEGRAILEELRWRDDDEAEQGPPMRTEITLAQAKQLILDWLAAKKEWQARQAATIAESPPTKRSPV